MKAISLITKYQGIHILIMNLLFTVCCLTNVSGQEMEIKPKDQSGCIPYHEKSGRLLLEASYNNESFLMIIDTYCHFSQLPSDWVVKKWKLKKTPYRHSTIDVNNKRSKVRLRLMDTISISNTFSASNFYIRPNKAFNSFEVGILGLDFFNDLNWKFDFRNNEICYNTQPYQLLNTLISNQFDRKTEFPWLTISIDQNEQKVIVDLGAGNDMMIPAGSKLGAYLIEKYKLIPRSVDSGGANKLGVSDIQYKIKLDSINIQGTPVKDVEIIISENTKSSYIGCGILKRGRLYLNFKGDSSSRGEIALDLYKN